jgi:23S rRNA (guanosine2251-2'-O)-methyltransferase
MKSTRRVFGVHAARAALEHTPEKLVAVWIDGQRKDRRLIELSELFAALGVVVEVSDRRRLDRLAEGNNHQGIVLQLELPQELGERALRSAVEQRSENCLLLILDHVQDPHNLGACLRTADAAGVHGVILTKDQSVGLTPTVYKVASGAAESVPLYRVTNLARVLKWLRQQNVWLIGAAGDGPKTLYQVDFTLPLALVIGAEGKGLRRLTRDECDVLVNIPMFGRVESLNLSVAAGVLLYEAVRQRRM